MDVIRTLKPGDLGTRKLLAQYGDQLVAVRYRVNKNAGKQYTTIELIIDEKAKPTLAPDQAQKAG